MNDTSQDSLSFDAVHLDGEIGLPMRLRVRIDLERGALIGPGVHWPLADIREQPDIAGQTPVILSRCDNAVERLILTDPSIRSRLPGRLRHAKPDVPRGRLLSWALAAVASVALILFVLVPLMADQLAEFIPPEGERALGEVTLTQIRDAMDDTAPGPLRLCTAPAGLSALRQIEARLTEEAALETEIDVHLLDHTMVNAFALPGGHIVFFRGLIEEAGSPEEVAAVFAHEIGHVASRDPTRHALRSAGSIGVLGLLFGDFAGGAVVLLLAERLIEAQYSQGAEAEADVFAHNLMIRAGIAPVALGQMFERFQALGGDEAGIVAHFLSHPSLGDRIAQARAATPPDFAPVPLLTETEWRALQDICTTTTD